MILPDSLTQRPEPDRTAGIVAWFQGLFERDPPVLVGGGAVELYTGGAYRTADLDFVGRIPTDVARELERAGFSKRGRHWIHEDAQIYIELPATSFDRDVRIDAIRIKDWTVILLSPEDVLVDRLAAWKFWHIPVEGINAYLLFRARRNEMDPKRLDVAARTVDVGDALDSLRSFAGRDREPEEIEAWARTVR